MPSEGNVVLGINGHQLVECVMGRTLVCLMLKLQFVLSGRIAGHAQNELQKKQGSEVREALRVPHTEHHAFQVVPCIATSAVAARLSR